MRDLPIATSSPLKGRIQRPNSRRGAKNKGRRSISLLDVSTIEESRDASKNSESNETLTSICKDSGYVQSEESCLDEEEEDEKRLNKGSVKDLVEELKFKDVLISELQESNRGLRLRCADAENKIWRLRIKCESHCTCCEVNGHVNDEKLSPEVIEEIQTSRSGTVDDFHKGLGDYNRHSWVPINIDSAQANVERPKECWKSFLFGKSEKQLARSSPSELLNAVPASDYLLKHGSQTNGAMNNHEIEDSSLSKVARWQRELEETKKTSPVPTNLGKFKSSISSDKDECTSIRPLSPFQCSSGSSELPFKTIDESLERLNYLDLLKKQNEPPKIDSGQLGNSSDSLKRCRREVKSPICHSQSFDFIRDRNYKNNAMNCSDDIDGLFKSRGESELFNSSNPKFVFHGPKLPNLKEDNFEKTVHCPGCRISVVPTHIVVIPNCSGSTNACFCQSHLQNTSHCRGQCISHSCTNKPDADHPCSRECSRSSFPPSKEHRLNHRTSTHPPSFIENENCQDPQYDDRPESFCNAVVPLARKEDNKDELIRRIEEGVEKIVSDSKAEMDSLSFKPWPPSDFAKMSRMMQCLAETSHYVHRLNIDSNKVCRKLQTLS